MWVSRGFDVLESSAPSFRSPDMSCWRYRLASPLVGLSSPLPQQSWRRQYVLIGRLEIHQLEGGQLARNIEAKANNSLERMNTPDVGEEFPKRK